MLPRLSCGNITLVIIPPLMSGSFFSFTYKLALSDTLDPKDKKLGKRRTSVSKLIALNTVNCTVAILTSPALLFR